MKSLILFSRISLLIKSMLLACGLQLLCMHALHAQHEPASAQAGSEASSQSQQVLPNAPARPNHKMTPKSQVPGTLLQITPQRSADAALQLWGRDLPAQQQPAQPHRPIPIVLFVLGLLMLAMWTAILLAAILVGSTALAVVFFIACLVLSPLLIIGTVLLIGACMSGFSRNKKPKQATNP